MQVYNHKVIRYLHFISLWIPLGFKIGTFEVLYILAVAWRRPILLLDHLKFNIVMKSYIEVLLHYKHGNSDYKLQELRIQCDRKKPSQFISSLNLSLPYLTSSERQKTSLHPTTQNWIVINSNSWFFEVHHKFKVLTIKMFK